MIGPHIRHSRESGKGHDLIPLGEQSHDALIAATVELGNKEGKNLAGLVREDDYPINIEGAAFRDNGNLLLGLRFPTTAEGRPILVELRGIDRLFEPGGDLPEVAGFWTADAVGKDGEIAGVRDLAFLTARFEEGVPLPQTAKRLHRGGVFQDLVGVGLRGDLGVDLGDCPFSIEQEGDAVRTLPVLA